MKQPINRRSLKQQSDRRTWRVGIGPVADAKQPLIINADEVKDSKKELLEFQQEWVAALEDARLEMEDELDKQADQLGVRGLLRLIQRHEELLYRHALAIEDCCKKKE